MITLPIAGRGVMIGDRTAEGARQILIGEHRFSKANGAWQNINEEDWQTNVPSIELSATSVLGLDGELFDQSVPYGTELEELLGARVVELTQEQRDEIALIDMINTTPPRALEGASAEDLVEAAKEKQAQFDEANGIVRLDAEEQDEELEE